VLFAASAILVQAPRQTRDTSVHRLIHLKFTYGELCRASRFLLHILVQLEYVSGNVR
jgi:hypothetical protein